MSRIYANGFVRRLAIVASAIGGITGWIAIYQDDPRPPRPPRYFERFSEDVYRAFDDETCRNAPPAHMIFVPGEGYMVTGNPTPCDRLQQYKSSASELSGYAASSAEEYATTTKALKESFEHQRRNHYLTLVLGPLVTASMAFLLIRVLGLLGIWVVKGRARD